MKKVININFQGRVIPIEESAHELLKQYTESLSNFFANEEGKEEIINDIEGRIAELFADALKKGSTCISDADVNKIINSIGRPEDFETEEIHVQEQLGNNRTRSNNQNRNNFDDRERTRLYRDDNDKVVGGVCGGLAHYLRVDASIIRILFVILTLGAGTGFLIYLLMWVILPSRSLKANLTKRLYRNPEEKVVAGVGSGIAAYFNIAVWIPRLIFAFPLVIGIVNAIFHNLFWNFTPFPSIFFGSFGSSLALIYCVLWAVIPEANTASEKLEMRGDKVDLNSIKATIQDDLEGFKERAEKWAERIEEKGKQFAAESTVAAKKHSNRFVHAVGIVFKAIFLFVAGMIAFMLLMGLLKLSFNGFRVFPIKNFFLNGFWENTLAWVTVICFLFMPVIALLVWIIRRVFKAKAHSRAIGATFGILWSIGLMACIALGLLISNNFKNKRVVEETITTFVQPSKNKLIIKVDKEQANYYGNDWLGLNWDIDTDEDYYDNHRNNNDWSFYGVNADSLLLRDIRINLVKSSDDKYHVHLFKFSRGKSAAQAIEKASLINFPMVQNDSILMLPNGFFVTQKNKFRDQEVLLVIEVPKGKKIQMDGGIDIYNWFGFNMTARQKTNISWNENWNQSLQWFKDEVMIMGEKELIKTYYTHEESESKKNELEEIERQQKELEQKKKDLLQQELPKPPAPPAKPADSTRKTNTTSVNQPSASDVSISNILLDKFSI